MVVVSVIITMLNCVPFSLLFIENYNRVWGVLPLVDRECHHSILLLVERNVHQIGMPPLVERDCHHWMFPLVDTNLH